MSKTGALTFAAALALLALFAIRADRFARSASQTFDEGAHLVAGVSYWRTGDFRINPEHPPLLKLLWAIPVALRSDVQFQPDADAWDKRDHWRLADQFLYDGPVDHFEMLLAARRVNIAFGVMLVALTGWWAYRLWGRPAGILACGLAAFDPNLAAFAALLSMDLGLTLFATSASYAFWEFTRNGSRWWFVLTGIAIGLALASKFSAVITLGGLVIAASGYTLAGSTIALRGATIDSSLRSRLSALMTVFVRLTLIACVVVLISYFGINALDWPAGFKQQLVRGEFGDPHFFLNGDISSKGWWYYFFEVLAIKTPVWMLILLAVGIASLVRRRPDRRELAFVYMPAMIYFLAMILSGIDIGWRVILPAYPALILLAARSVAVITFPASTSRSVRIIAHLPFFAVLLLAVVDLFKGPGELSYSNGIIAGRHDLHRYLGDSNLDWGQGLKAIKTELGSRGDQVIYLAYAGTARPEAYGIRHERLPTWGQFHTPPADRVDPVGPILFAVSVSNLQGTYLNEPTMYRWLMDREPVSRTDGSIWLWDLTGDTDAIEQVRNLARGP
jgi:hypothetical protein